MRAKRGAEDKRQGNARWARGAARIGLRWAGAAAALSAVALGAAALLAPLGGCGAGGGQIGESFGPGITLESVAGLVLFATTRDFNSEIYYVNANSEEHEQNRVTLAIFSSETDPCWSPDGTQIAFVSNRTGNPEIWRMNADGTNPMKLTDDRAEDLEPAWSPDGTRIAFKSNRDHELYEIYTMSAIDGSDVRRITNNEQSDNSPSWSPDGTRLVVSRVTLVGATGEDSYGDLVIVDASGNGNEVQLTQHQPGEVAQHPCWGVHNGEEWIVYAYRPSAAEDTDIYRMRPDGTDITRLTTDGARNSQPCFSPDGSKIAFQKFRRGSFDIYVMDFDGSNEQVLAESEEADTAPAWSPVPVQQGE